MDTSLSRISSKRTFYFLFFFIILRVLLQIGLPVYLLGDFSVDDNLLMNYAQNIIQGSWLGDYNVYTLNKVPGFSLYMAILRSLNIPYMLGIALCWSFACLLFYHVFKGICSHEWLTFGGFLYLLFSPAMLCLHAQRTYRMAIIPILALIVVSSYIAIFEKRNQSFTALIPWSIIAAVSFSWFYITREDPMWLFFFVVAATLITVLLIIFDPFKKTLKETLLKIGCICLPLFLCFITVHGLCLINYNHYGIYQTTDYKDGNYAKMGKLLLSIAPDEELEQVWINRSTVEQLYKLSPAFSTLQPYLDRYYEAWDGESTGRLDGEIDKDYVIWCIRWAAGDAGVYSQGASYAENFYAHICNDIEKAFRNGTLKKREKIIVSSLARPFDLKEDSFMFLSCISDIAQTLLNYEDFSCQILPSKGSETEIELMSEMTVSNPVYTDTGGYELSGWIFPVDATKATYIYLIHPNLQKDAISWNPSDDVYRAYINQLPDASATQNCRFSIRIPKAEINNARIVIEENGQTIVSATADEFINILKEGISGYHNSIDYYTYFEGKQHLNKYYKQPVAISNMIISFYQHTGLILAIIAFASFCAETFVLITRQATALSLFNSLWIVELGLLLTVLANIAIVSFNYMDAANRDNATTLYTLGSIPLIQFFICLTLNNIPKIKLLYYKRKPTSITHKQ